QGVYEPAYYRQFENEVAIDRSGPSSNSALRVFRGGGVWNFSEANRSAYRFAAALTHTESNVGFRVALPFEAVQKIVKREQSRGTAKRLKDPAFQKWMKYVAGRPAAEQVREVMAKLQELNPGFKGQETHAIENGVVTSLSFMTDRVTDVGPVRALPGLKSFDCPGSLAGQGTLVDLSPLKGLQLTRLNCMNNAI